MPVGVLVIVPLPETATDSCGGSFQLAGGTCVQALANWLGVGGVGGVGHGGVTKLKNSSISGCEASRLVRAATPKRSSTRLSTEVVSRTVCET